MLILCIRTNVRSILSTFHRVYTVKGLSNSLNSLLEPKAANVKAGAYLPMRPIKQKSATDLTAGLKFTVFQTPSPPPRSPIRTATTTKTTQLTQNSIKQTSVTNLNSRSNDNTSGSTGSERMDTSRRYQCVDEYVQMSLCPSSSSNHSSLNSVTKLETATPPSSNAAGDEGDYGHINEIGGSQGSGATSSFANVRQLTHDNLSLSKHSPTPECPPPSVTQAESAIFEAIKPLTLNKRKSLGKQRKETIDEDLQIFIDENLKLDQANARESESNSQMSDSYVEKFVGDQPFAGLFKGSTLNLNIEEDDADADPLAARERHRLRSPSLVRSIKPKPPPRNLKNIRKTSTNSSKPATNIDRSTPTAKEDINVVAVWEEINTILKSIGNEVSSGDNSFKLELNLTTDLNEDERRFRSLARKDTFKIRQPADLTLGRKTAATQWRHSTTTLIYGQILYDVFYLGSTIIRELQGTTSTRKSIQKLKRDESTEELEDSLLKDCNSFTKILKEHNQQMRLKVGISLSYSGVKFIDDEKKTAICVHDIQNINCVCQDAEDLRYFAYITKEQDLHYCHVFMVDNLELATEIILTLGQAFEVAYQLAMNDDVNSSIPEEGEEEKRNSSYYVDVEDKI